MILPFVLDAASAIFWNVSKKEPKLAVAPLEIKKKNNQTFNIIQSLIYQRKGKLFYNFKYHGYNPIFVFWEGIYNIEGDAQNLPLEKIS